jgi:hypothetical protein
MFTCYVVAGAAASCFFVSAGPAGSATEPSTRPSVYHTDPDHLWNRLYESLFVRVGPDGRAYGQDRLEPLLWLERSSSRYLEFEQENWTALRKLLDE